MLREAGVDERLRLLEKEMASLGDEMADLRLRLMAETEGLQIELGTLKRFLALALPDFERRYAMVRESVIQGDQSEPESGTQRNSGGHPG
jgi:hypothetical protein